MRFPLFRRGRRALIQRASQTDAEQLLANGLRVLGQMCGRVADLLEAQRLERSGYRNQGKFLERLDPGARRGKKR